MKILVVHKLELLYSLSLELLDNHNKVYLEMRILKIQLTFWQPERELKLSQMETSLIFPSKLAQVAVSSIKLSFPLGTFQSFVLRDLREIRTPAKPDFTKSTLTSAFWTPETKWKHCAINFLKVKMPLLNLVGKYHRKYLT